MNKRDARMMQKAMGYCLLMFSVSAAASEAGFTEAQNRDPFSESRISDDKTEYPSVLTAPDFEASVTSVKPQVKPAAVAAAPKMTPNTLRTPVQPVMSTGTSPVQRYASAVSSYPTRALVLHENILLSQGLNQWAKDSGYKMLWNSNKDYMIYSTITYTGATADDVLGDLGKLFASENYGLVIKLYQKNKVLLVDEQ